MGPRRRQSNTMTPDAARAILKDHGWTQKQVADGLDISLRTAQRWFNAKTKHVPGPLAVVLTIWRDHPATRPPALTEDP